MIRVIDKSACSHNTIAVQPDDLGFVYLVVNMEKCTDCGLCEKVCDFNLDDSKGYNLETPFVYAYATKHERSY